MHMNNMTFLTPEPGGEMKGRHLLYSLSLPSLSLSLLVVTVLSLPNRGRAGVPTSKGSVLRGSKVIIHPPLSPSFKAH